MLPEPEPDAPPTAVRVAGVLASLQGAAGLVVALVIAVGGFTGPGTLTVALSTAGWFGLCGGVLAAVGVSLVRGGHGARTPAVVAQLLLLGVAWYAVGPSSRPEYGLPGGALCAVVLVLLFTPSAARWAQGLDVDRE